MPNLKYSIRFNLQQNKLKSKKTSLRCIVRFNNTRCVFGTNIQIEPRYFNTKSQSVRNSAYFDGADVEGKLDEVRDFVDNIFDRFDRYPDAKDLELQCKTFIGSARTSKEDKDTKFTYLIAFMEDLTARMADGSVKISKGVKRGKNFKQSSIKNYNSVLSIFKRYALFCKKKDFKFEEVNKYFYDGLQSFFYSELKYSTGYFSTVIKTLKTVMSESLKRNLHSSTDFMDDHFVKPDYEADTIYLNIDQLDKINNVTLESIDLEQARDLFLIGCWTGLRFSDFSTLTISDIEGNFIRVITEKTEDRITIPFHPVLRQVLERNGGQFPKPISNQKLNENIKTVAKRAKLSKKVSVKRNRGGRDIYEEVNFCNLISTHTARRSFATNMFKMGIPTLIIMAITGHKTEKSFLKYIRVSNEEKAHIMLDMWKKLGWG